MAFTYPIQANFSRGEIAPALYGRVDIEHYRMALKTCTNWTVMRHGGLRRRPGTVMVKEVLDSTKKTRVIPFVFGTASNGIPQAYALEFGNLYMRVYVNKSLVTTGGGVPTAITQANPAVVTMAGHGFSNGDKVYVTGVGGMAELNNREFSVANAAANTFELSGVNSAAYGAFTTGGLVKKIVQIVTPYLEADLWKLDYTQSADVLKVTGFGYQPFEISRTSDTAWTIAPVVFKDGPYFDEPIANTNGITPSATNAIHPQMTSNTAPSGTVFCTGDGGSIGFQMFDRNKNNEYVVALQNAEFRYTPSAPCVVNSYWIMASTVASSDSPCSWDFQGFDGTNWITLDSQKAQTSWAGGETRYFSFVNTKAFQAYRINDYGAAVPAANGLRITESGWGYNGDYAPAMSLTFDSAVNVNKGAGFSANDVGRNIRLFGSDGKWRWFVVTAVSSATVVSGRMYGFALPDLTKIVRWKLGAFYNGNWPAKCGFFQSRAVFAKTPLEPFKVWLTKTFDFYDMGTSQPLVDDDAITVNMQTGRVNSIRWLADGENLNVGTTDNVRVLTRANMQVGFSASNFQSLTRSQVGSADVRPITVQQTTLFADFYGKIIREFVFNQDNAGFVANNVSILSDHLLSSGIVEMAYQKSPDSIIWVVTGDGGLVSMTYDQEQKIVGLTPCPIAGGDSGTKAIVESVCSIPGASQDDVYLVVRRTIEGAVRRFVEVLAPAFEVAALASAVVGVDSAITYAGSPTSVVTGAAHLAGLTVNALADGMVVRGLVVSATGKVTLPFAASTITLGLPYSSVGVTLPMAQLSQDGVHLGRKAQAGELYFSVMDSLGLKVKGLTSIDAYEVFRRDTAIDPISGAMVPREGLFQTRLDSSWKQNGQFQFFVDDPLPCTVRAVVIGATGEP